MPREPTAQEIRGRIERFQAELRSEGLAGALIVQNIDRYYFSGTMQGGFVVVPESGDPLVLIRKDAERAAQECPLPVEPLDSVRDVAARVRARFGEIPSPLGLELDVLPVNQAERLCALLGRVEIRDASRAILMTRAVKSAFEVEKIRESARVMAEVVEQVPRFLGEGVTEMELAARLECELRVRGHGGVIRMRGFNQEMFYGQVVAGHTAAVVSLFDAPIGGLGLGPALPQGPSFRPIGSGEPVVVDLIGNACGYLSDVTRMFSVGPPRNPFEAAFEAALAVQCAVVEAAGPGVLASHLYRVAVEAAGQTEFAEHFMGDSHKVSFVGHGMGLEVDEYPFLANGAQLPLAEGMVFAVEPKFTFAGRGVVGVEDTYLVTCGGVERLTPSPQVFRIVDAR